MARKKTNVEQSVEASELVIPSCFVEEDDLDDVIREHRQFSNSINLGNGGYITRPRAMSDDI